MKLLSLLLALAIHGVLAGCASLPEPVPQPPTFALTEVSQTQLGRVAANSLPPDQPTLSGFRLLPEGPTAFDARIALARRAQKSLDAQYYLIGNDTVGQQFLRELRDAAVRGVRVRLLVNDIYTAGEDALLTGLAAFPNIEVRLFNPLPSRVHSLGWRIVASWQEFGRINHRMHNKLFIADNSMAVSGGRNMAAEYFTQSPTDNFIDLDVLSAGPVVRKLSAAFDGYWNSPYVFPVGRVNETLPSAQARQRFDELVQHAGVRIDERAQDVLGHTPVAVQLDAGRLALVFAPARVFADNPRKVAADADSPAAEPTVTQQTLALIASAQEALRITSPYFIPGKPGLSALPALSATDENGRITLVTNSLESTDEPLVHAEYAKHRMDLLKAGVRIYELGGALARRTHRTGVFGHSITHLHTKVAIIDRRLVFIGSMNMDPRSAIVNTEMGIVIDSPEIAQTLLTLFNQNVSYDAYRLRLTPDGNAIEWVETDVDGGQKIHLREPGDTWWLRFQIWLLAPFVDASLL